MSFCTNCGVAVNPNQRYCVVCGQQLLASSNLPAAPPLTGERWSDAHAGDARVIVGLSHAAPRQARWSILLRVVISIPLMIWLLLVSFAAGVVLVISWFAAVFTAQVPREMQRFMTSALRYDAKVTAYLCLLIDRWPGLWLEARSVDQISLDIDHVRLNRFAVFFRMILAVPSALVSGVLGVGAYFLTFVMWICALVLGRVPQSLHEARGQIWRFTTRASAYIQLLTPTQPFEGFFGDATLGVAATVPVAGADAPLSTTWSLAKLGKVFFILTLLVGAYFEVQPGLTRWPYSYAFDRLAGPAIVAAINQNIVFDLANYTTSTTGGCVSDALGGCPVDAATAQTDISGQLRALQTFEPFVVEGRHEYLAYVNEVLLIDLTLEQAANAPTTGQVTFSNLVVNEETRLGPLYDAVHRAL